MSSLTFLMSLCRVLSDSFAGDSSLTQNAPSASKKRFQNFRKKRAQPSMPFESHGLLWLMGPRNIS